MLETMEVVTIAFQTLDKACSIICYRRKLFPENFKHAINLNVQLQP